MRKIRLRHPNTALLVVATAVGLYLAALLAYAHLSERRLHAAFEIQQQLLLDHQASALSSRIDQGQRALDHLARTIPLQDLFTNRPAGDVADQGRRDSLAPVTRALRTFRERQNAQGLPLFERIAVADRTGHILADSANHQPARRPDTTLVAPPSGPFPVRHEGGQSSLALASAVRDQGQAVGLLIAELATSTLLRPPLSASQRPDTPASPGPPRLALLDPDGSLLIESHPGTWDLHQSQAGSSMTGVSVGDLGLHLAALRDAPALTGPAASLTRLAPIALLGIPLLLAVVYLWRINNRHLMLHARIKASRRQRTRLRQQNERLRNEIDRRIASEQELSHQANYDQLTGLPNRNLALDRLDQAIRWARREEARVLTLFIDLDRFKQVNDSIGHAAGDDLLRETARRLLSRVRDRDTVARLGGDEFLVICNDAGAPAKQEAIGHSLLQALAAPFFIGDHEFFVGGSIGMAAFPEAGETPDRLLKNADIAMYAAKERGRNTCAIYDPTMDALAVESFRLERSLRHALARDELYIEFQPIVDLSSGRTVAFETLLRWHNAELGEVPPDKFIPVAEESGLIHEIGEWALREACQTLSGYDECAHLRVSVNLSPKQFSRPSQLLDSVLGALKISRLMPEQLEIDITESILIDDRVETVQLINQLDRIGVRLSLDDFGTGYSALNYLQRFPFDALKIDRSFTRQLPDCPATVSLIKAIIAMAHAFELEVIAEGIETRQQAGFLLIYHCELGQGFLYSRPLLPEHVVDHLRDNAAALTA